MKKIQVSLVLALVLVLIAGMPAYADTALPDADPTIEEINVWRNILETGDWLIVVYANIPYTVLPDDPVTSTFIWRLIDTDGVTELGTTLGIAYNDSGYGYNVYSFYFSAAEVTALGLTWGVVYTMRLSGNPVAFDSPPVYNFSITAADYSLMTDTTAVQSEIAARVLALAADLENKWGLAIAYSLLTQTESATVLSIYGESFFRGAIWGLQAMAPDAFSVVITAIDLDDRAWTDNYSANLTGQYSGTWVETAQEAGQALFGTDYDLLSLIMLLVMGGGLLMGNVMITGDAWNGLLDVSVIGVIGARLGMYDLGLLILVAAMCWLYISAKIWFGLLR